MSSTVPTVRQVAWVSLIPQLILVGLLILAYHKQNTENPVLFGTLTYVLLSITIRPLLINKSHKLGMKLIKQEKYADAIPCFIRSYDFFKRYEWLDKYRYLTLLSSSKMSYKEMALNNIAFCYGQAGDGIRSKEYYERTLQEFPDSGLAKAGLRLINSVDKQRAEK